MDDQEPSEEGQTEQQFGVFGGDKGRNACRRTNNYHDDVNVGAYNKPK